MGFFSKAFRVMHKEKKAHAVDTKTDKPNKLAGKVSEVVGAGSVIDPKKRKVKQGAATTLDKYKGLGG